MKKLISLLLVLCMAFSLMAMSVSAEEVTVDPNLQDSWNYVNDAENKIFDGNENPKDEVTRGDYAIYMARLVSGELNADFTGKTLPAGKLPDMDAYKISDPTLYAAVAYCYELGLVNGRGDGNYHPEQTVTREQICALLYRAYVEPVNEVEEAPLAEVFTLSETDNVTSFTGEISDWAEDAVEWAATHGIIVGHGDGTFNKEGDTPEVTSQEQMAAILHRFAKNEDKAVSTTKFKLVVESGEGYAKIVVNHAYVMQITLSPQKLSPKSVTLTAEMNDVASLGVEGKKYHSVTVDTGLGEELNPSLKDWMLNTWKFEGCRINIMANTGSGIKSCAYEVTGATSENGDRVITFVPVNVDETRAVWHGMINKETITVTEYEDDNSYVTVDYVSSLRLGPEYLYSPNAKEGGELVLDNFSDLDTMEQKIRDNFALKTEQEPGVNLMFQGGLRIGQTEAKLNDWMTFTVEAEGLDVSELHILSDLRSAESTYAMARTLILGLDQMVGMLDDLEEATVKINYGPRAWGGTK